MKTRVCLAMLLLVAVAASARAQTFMSSGSGPLRPGAVQLLGGTSVSFGRQTLSSAGEAGINSDTQAVNAGIGYFVTKNVSVGVSANYQNLTLPISRSEEIGLSTTGFGPQVQFRFPVSEKAAFWVAGSVGYTKFHLKGGGVDALVGDTTGTYVGGGAGISAFVTESVAIDMGVLYQKSKLTQDSTHFDAAGFTVALGFALFLGGHR